MRRTILPVFAMLWLIAPLPLTAQQPAAPEEEKRTLAPAERPAAVVYRLDFIVHELENSTRINSRSYRMLVRDGSGGRARAASKVNVPEHGWYNISVGIDCSVQQRSDAVELNVTLEVDDFVFPKLEGAAGNRPVQREFRAHIPAAVVPGKSTIIARLDDAVSQRRYELEVTATKVP